MFIAIRQLLKKFFSHLCRLLLTSFHSQLFLCFQISTTSFPVVQDIQRKKTNYLAFNDWIYSNLYRLNKAPLGQITLCIVYSSDAFKYKYLIEHPLKIIFNQFNTNPFKFLDISLMGFFKASLL